MSLRWSSHVAPKSPKGAYKRKTAYFGIKSHFAWRKSATKFILCENCQRQSCKAFIGLTTCAIIIRGGRLLVPKLLGKTYRVGVKSAIFDLFLLAAPQPQHLAKKVQLSLIGSPLRAFQWAQHEHRTLSLSPSLQRVAQKRKESKIWSISCDNSETLRDRMPVTINY